MPAANPCSRGYPSSDCRTGSRGRSVFPTDNVRSSIQNNLDKTEKNNKDRRWTGVADKSKSSNEQRRREMAEKLWLNYFNDSLFQQSIITEAERNRIKNKIENRKPSTAYSQNRAAFGQPRINQIYYLAIFAGVLYNASDNDTTNSELRIWIYIMLDKC